MAESIYLTYTDSNNTRRLQKFDRSEFKLEFTTGHDTHTSTFSYVVALDSSNNELTFFETSGPVVTTHTNTQLGHMEHLFADAVDGVYVTGPDDNNVSIQKWDENGLVWENGGFTDGTITAAEQNNSESQVITLDSNGTVHVLDDTNGNLITEDEAGVVNGSIRVGFSAYYVTGEDLNRINKLKAVEYDDQNSPNTRLRTIEFDENARNRALYLEGDVYVFPTAENLWIYEKGFFFQQKKPSELESMPKSAYVLDNDNNENVHILHQRDDGQYEWIVYNNDIQEVFRLLVPADINSTPTTADPKVTVENSGTYTPLPAREKSVNLRFYDSNDNQEIQENLQSFPITNSPSFTEKVNGSQGAMRLEFSKDYAGIQSIIQNNTLFRVDVIVHDKESPESGLLLYRGYQVKQRFSQDENGASTIVIEYGGSTANMERVILEDANGNTRFSYSDTEVGAIMRDVIDRYRSMGGRVDYTADSIQDTGVKIDFTVREQTLLDVINSLVEYTPRYWYWYMGPDEIVTLQQANLSRPDKFFMYGRELVNYEYTLDRSEILNTVYFAGGKDNNGNRLFWKFTNQTSRDEYGIYADRFSDGRVTRKASAELVADQAMKNSAVPVRSVSGEIVDSNAKTGARVGADTEDLKPGDVISINDPDVRTIRTTWASSIPKGDNFAQTGSAEVTKDSNQNLHLRGTDTKFTTALNTRIGVSLPIGNPRETVSHSESSTNEPVTNLTTDEGRNLYACVNESGSERVEKFDVHAFGGWTYSLGETPYYVEHDEGFLYVGSETKLTKLDEAGNKVWEMTGLTGPVRTLAAHERWDVVYFADSGDQVKAANTITGVVNTTYTTTENSNVTALATGRDNHIYIGKANGEMEALLPDLATQIYEVANHSNRIHELYVQRDTDSAIYSASADNTVQSADRFSGSVNWTNSDPTDEVTDIDSHPQNASLYVVGLDGVHRELDSGGTQTQTYSMESFTVGSGDLRTYSVAVDEFTSTVGYEDSSDETERMLTRVAWSERAIFKVTNVTDDTNADLKALNGVEASVPNTSDWQTKEPQGSFIWDITYWGYDVNAGLGIAIRVERVRRNFYTASFEASELSSSVSQTIQELKAGQRELDGRDTPDKPS